MPLLEPEVCVPASNRAPSFAAASPSLPITDNAAEPKINPRRSICLNLSSFSLIHNNAIYR